MEALLTYGSSSDSEDDTGEHSTAESSHSEIKGQTLTRQHQLKAGGRGYISKRKRGAALDHTSDAESVTLDDLKNVQEYLSSKEGGVKRMKKGNWASKTCIDVFRDHSKPVLALQWHPFDSRLLLSASLDGTVRLWDATRQRRCIATYSGLHCGAVWDVVWITGNSIVSGGFDNSAKFSDIETGRTMLAMDHKGIVTTIKVHPGDKNLVFTGDSDANIQSWDLRSGERVSQYVGAGGKILDIEFYSCEQFVATSDIVRRNAASQALAVWDITSTVVLSNQVYLEPYTCPCLRKHPYESTFMAQSNGNYVVIFSSNKPYKLNKYKRFEGHSVEGYSVGFDVSPDGSMLCSASANGQVYFYDYFSGKILRRICLSQSPSLSVAWHPALPSTVSVSDWSGLLYILQ